jgi:hypothetical protein
MKTYYYRSRNAVILMTACVLFLSTYVANQSMGSDVKSRRGHAKSSAFVQSISDPARLVIRRIANLGNNVIVDLYVDGAPVAAIGYGHTYEGSLPPGHHVLSVLPTPGPIWPDPPPLVVDVQPGQTYTFTAAPDPSGSLILKGG